MILVIDNFDSFVHNLARYFRQLGLETKVVRNDGIRVEQIEALGPEAIVLSPGPCTPDEAGVSLEVVARFADRVPILGVCLGHQAIVQALGGQIVRTAPMHGRSSPIEHDATGIFAGLPSPMTVGRYHSLVADPDSLPDCLNVNGRADDGSIMAVAHRSYPVIGVQFHPESILTESGHILIANFLALANVSHSNPVEKSLVSDRSIQSQKNESGNPGPIVTPAPLSIGGRP